MKKTYAFMWAAGLGLMGAPFITTGFWSKDAVFAAVFDSGIFEWALPIHLQSLYCTAVFRTDKNDWNDRSLVQRDHSNHSCCKKP